MPVISAVIAKHKFVEIGIDVLAAQALICPEAPSSHQRKSSMNPRQHSVRGHLANDARIMPVACQTRIGFVAVGEQRGGNLERCITVPAVTEVCRPQSRHSCKRGRLFSAATRRLPQAGQTKPSGHRRLNIKAAQLASSENASRNCENERALAINGRPGDRANPIIQTTTCSAT